LNQYIPYREQWYDFDMFCNFSSRLGKDDSHQRRDIQYFVKKVALFHFLRHTAWYKVFFLHRRA